MRKPLFSCLAVLGLLVACQRSPDGAAIPSDKPSASVAPPIASASRAVDASVADASASKALMTDAQLGGLIDSLSEATGDFPSDNYVSNETSYLDVVPALRSEALRGKGYVGVGPEQNFTYIAVLQPEIAYVVDIRRQNLLQHLWMRVCLESSMRPAEFLAAMTSRKIPEGKSAAGMTVEEMLAWLSELPGDKDAVEPGVERAMALMTRLGMHPLKTDKGAVRRVVKAFLDKGLSMTYSMQGSGRRYPSLGMMLGQKDPGGNAASFVASEDSYQRVRRMVMDNRVIPIVGDFSGEKALASVGRDMAGRGIRLGAFYTSNVEQYLFEGAKYGKFVSNVSAFQVDDSSVFVRVWFDQGRKHPKQKQGHRTTSLVMPIKPWLEGNKARPARSYWQVVSDG